MRLPTHREPSTGILPLLCIALHLIPKSTHPRCECRPNSPLNLHLCLDSQASSEPCTFFSYTPSVIEVASASSQSNFGCCVLNANTSIPCHRCPVMSSCSRTGKRYASRTLSYHPLQNTHGLLCAREDRGMRVGNFYRRMAKSSYAFEQSSLLGRRKAPHRFARTSLS